MAASNELATLFPEPLVVQVAGEEVPVPELPVRKLPRFAEILAPVLARYEPGTDILQLLIVGGEPAIEGVAYAVSRPVAWASDLTPADFEKLLRAVQEANRDFFRDHKRIPHVRRHGDDIDRGITPWGWPDVILLLRRYGVRDPGNCTLREIDMYLPAIERIEHDERRERIVDARVATATQDSFDRFMRMFDARFDTRMKNRHQGEKE
jgi:hypothetical protein